MVTVAYVVCILGFQIECEFGRKKKGLQQHMHTEAHITLSSGLAGQPAPPRRKPARAAGYVGRA